MIDSLLIWNLTFFIKPFSVKLSETEASCLGHLNTYSVLWNELCLILELKTKPFCLLTAALRTAAEF